MGIYDRDYIREEDRKAAARAAAATPAAYLLLAVTGLVVFLETFANSRDERSPFFYACSFSVAKFQTGEVWRAVTYPIVSEQPMAYFFQLCILLIFGRPFERRFGASWLVGTYFGTAAVGALVVWAFTAIGMLGGDPFKILEGPAPAMLGLLGACFIAMGRQETTLHLPGPSPFEMRWVALAAAAIGLFSVAHTHGQPSGRFPATFALLAGLGVGAAVERFGERRRREGGRARWSSRRRDDEPIVVKFPASKGTASADDVDDLLEKISVSGIDSLTGDERDRLNAASAKRRQQQKG